MSLQHTENQKVSWLHSKAYRVLILSSSVDEHREWCVNNVQTNSWRVISSGENEHSFFFKEPQDHTLFRKQFLNSDRIMDIQ